MTHLEKGDRRGGEISLMTHNMSSKNVFFWAWWEVNSGVRGGCIGASPAVSTP